MLKDIVEKELDDDNFEIDLDSIDDIDYEIREMHPVTRTRREIWTTYIDPTDIRAINPR